MTTATENWKSEFGVNATVAPRFFAAKQELRPSTPQAHLLRRAFDDLKVDGVLCADHAPLIYFKQTKRLTAKRVYELHKQFWNHGGAPVLVLISDEQVQVYSGMTGPTADVPVDGDLPSLVETLDRVASGLREFLTSVESGEFFHKNARYFNPAERVDRDLLNNLKDARDKLGTASHCRIPETVLDALLCRLVFTCYLFDRKVIGESYLSGLGIKGASHLREVLNRPPKNEAKAALYGLFKKLGEDFNGDLFSHNLEAEAPLILDEHVQILSDFFQGTTIRTGQKSFWPYDFAFIPIETISAIYERFLKASDQQTGAFYTPRFLAEVVLDIALKDCPSLIGKRFLDPACGSGIFLVGLFNRIAEEWKQANPSARNDRKSRELMQLLRESLFGVDISETACRIAAFSLYLAYLDQLSPRDIQELQQKGRALPKLIVSENDSASETDAGNIRHADFFDKNAGVPSDVAFVIGNPPWGGIAKETSPAGKWCAAQGKRLPDKQIAAAFVWKGAEHVDVDGRVCFVLPHGVLFNHSTTAIPFQKQWVQSHAIDRVLNLADLRFLLFEKVIHPAVVVSYQRAAPADASHRIEYWTPKGDWTVTKAEVITVAPQDRTSLTVGELLRNLDGPDAPQIWKQRYWATARDWRLLERLSLFPRLRDMVRQPREKSSEKRWLIAEGFQPLGDNDDHDKARTLSLPSASFIRASSDAVNLFLLAGDCDQLASNEVSVRSRSNKNIQIFRAPHVLVTKGFEHIAFADFDVSFQHALRGITGPAEDRELLMFLAGYLRTSLARYYIFHTTSNWGIYRPEVHVEEVLRVPFPLPDDLPNPSRGWQIVREVATLVDEAAKQTTANFLDRRNAIRYASAEIESLVNEYFDVLPMEQALIEDTTDYTIPSIQPTSSRMPVETVKPSSTIQQEAYRNRLCDMLNGWAKRGPFAVCGEVYGSESLGIGMAVLEKVERTEIASRKSGRDSDLLKAMDRLRKAMPQSHATLDLVRGVMVFDKKRLYIVKPLGQRHWSRTAAMNDADEIAGTLLMQPPGEDA
ncbi:MAG: N-6 DNA methylase [Planctomycetaceae bacterium]|nr:N-6 DNA methylase [Planctomycetaceae bacterium]